jgi:hypothetical protein
MCHQTIVLTRRPPVRIESDYWPVIAEAKDRDFEGQYEFQSFRRSYWAVYVRQHKDGRTIVYATYRYESNWGGERTYAAKRGVLLGDSPSGRDICAAITEICDDIANADACGEDAKRWPGLADDCIADMPAEDLPSE